MRLTKVIYWNLAKSEDDAAENPISDDAQKTLAKATQLLGSVLETYEALKTKPQMRKKVYQIKERRAGCSRSSRGSAKRTGRMTTTN